MVSIVWFRQDLRLADNPALAAAAQAGPVLPVYIRDETVPKGRELGGASRWRLHRSLVRLAESPRLAKDAAKFRSQIGWREFAYHLLCHVPEIPERNWKPAIDAYPWRTSAKDLKAWQKGLTPARRRLDLRSRAARRYESLLARGRPANPARDSLLARGRPANPAREIPPRTSQNSCSSDVSQGTRWWMPACASCGPRDTCTIACA